LIDLGIAAAFSIAISIAKESIAVSIGLETHVAVVIGCPDRQFPKGEAG
jgi:hypothetical protein